MQQNDFEQVELSTFFDSEDKSPGIEEKAEMLTTKQKELIQEVMNSRIREARAKKGYEVKGVGVDKEFPNLDNKNTK